MIDDKVLSRDGYSKSNRRVVALNNDKTRVKLAKIKSLYDENGNRRKKLIPIEKIFNFGKAKRRLYICLQKNKVEYSNKRMQAYKNKCKVKQMGYE